MTPKKRTADNWVPIKDTDGINRRVNIGDYACFKCGVGVEQCAEIIDIQQSYGECLIVFKAPPDGFEGELIAEAKTYTALAWECWTG